MTISDVLIVGSGPSAVSAAWPLVKAGLRVVMVDADKGDIPSPPDMDLQNFRSDPARWEHVLGKNLENVYPLGNRSPKFVTPLGQAVLGKNEEFIPVRTSHFTAPRSFAAGGLSNIWGALTSMFDQNDLRQFPFSYGDLAPSYHAVADRIGLSGTEDDMGAFHGTGAPLQSPEWLMPIGQKLMRNYMRGKKDPGFHLGLARNAVITEDNDDRLACNACGMCMHGCSRGSIYHSGFEIKSLRKYPNFTYLRGHTVQRLRNVGGNIQSVEAKVGSHTIVFDTKTLVLAAGTLNTTALVLQYHNAIGKKIRLLTNPAGAMAFLVPSMLISHGNGKHFSLGQLSYRLDLGKEIGCYTTGTLYGVDTLPLTIVADRLPVSRPVAMRLAAALAPALLIANCWLPGKLSQNFLSLESGFNGPELNIEGFTRPETKMLFHESMRRLSKAMRKLGALPLPGSSAMIEPGADAHLAGTLPMSREERDLTCTPSGELRPWRNVFVVDGAALSDLPAKHCTFTIMANADRIGTALARRLISSAESTEAVA